MAEPIPQALRMTFRDAAELDPDEYPGELVEGEWIPVTRSTYRHGEIAANVATAFKLYSRTNGEWAVASNDPGTKLSHRPDTLRGPDVALYRRSRKPTGKGQDGWMEGAPDVVAEIRSDSQSVASLMRKAREYFKAGALLVILLDPETEKVTVGSPPDRFSTFTAGQMLDLGEVLPGFRCPVSELFE